MSTVLVIFLSFMRRWRQELVLETSCSQNKGKKANAVPVFSIKEYRGREVELHSFLNPAPDDDEWST
jgi:hypothetical protein